jgi:hypothetical protein
MESINGWLHANRLLLIGLTLLTIGLVRFAFHWRVKSLDTILSEDPQESGMRDRKRREGASFGLVLAGLFLVAYVALSR